MLSGCSRSTSSRDKSSLGSCVMELATSIDESEICIETVRVFFMHDTGMWRKDVDQ